MIEDRKLAGEVSTRVLEVNRLLNEAVLLVSEGAAETDEEKRFRHSIGDVLGELLVAIVNPLYRRHPDLKPEGLLVPGVDESTS